MVRRDLRAGTAWILGPWHSEYPCAERTASGPLYFFNSLLRRYWRGPDTVHLIPMVRSDSANVSTWRSTRPVRRSRSSEGCPPKTGNPVTLTSNEVSPSGGDALRMAFFSSFNVRASPASKRNFRNRPPYGASIESSTRKIALCFFAMVSITTRVCRDGSPFIGLRKREVSRNSRSVGARCEALWPEAESGGVSENVAGRRAPLRGIEREDRA